MKRELTGVGSFTTFACAGAGDATQLGLNALIEMPGVPSGMGAVLFCRGGEPEMLEVYTFGSEPWDGDPAGFSIGAAG